MIIVFSMDVINYGNEKHYDKLHEYICILIFII